MPPSTFDIQLNRLAYGGDAIGRLPDNRAVFVPFGLPGERVRIRLVEERPRFARAELLEVLEPAPERITPKCKHFGVCGGCHYQNLAYADQLVVKTDILREQLQRIGKIENPPVEPMVACPHPWNYRNHVQFHLTSHGGLGYISALPPAYRAPITKPGIPEGENSPGNLDPVIAVIECHLPETSLDALWRELELEPEMPVERVSLRAGMDDDLMLILESDALDAPELQLEADISVVHLTDEDALVMAGEDYIYTLVLGREFRVSAASFFQVNTSMAETMVEYLLANLPLPTKTILDIYCGVGLFSAFLADKCNNLIGIEVSPSACDDFSANLDQFENVELFVASAESALPAIMERTDNPLQKPSIVLVDPPRAGLDKHALDGIVQIHPETIAYVSCDPSTLARDAARLIAAGYLLERITPFDLFPQTYHIESISLFKRR